MVAPDALATPLTHNGMPMQSKDPVTVRLAVEADIPKLLPLMRGLAEFERYADSFAVTEDVLRERGFRRSPPDFFALVADGGNGLIGMAVFYIGPFTAEAVPALYIKELFVTAEPRGRHVGDALMRAGGGPGGARERV